MAWSYAVTTQMVGSEERIVIAGHAQPVFGGPFVAVLWRLTGAGQLDSSFGANGIVRTSFWGFDDGFNDVAIDSSGQRIVAVGYSYTAKCCTNYGIQLVLAGFDQDGALDPSFGPAGNGKVFAPIRRGYDEARAVGMGANGSIWVAGVADDRTDPGNDFAGLWRFTPEGLVDETFGDNGWVPDPIVSTSASSACWMGLVMQADGKVVCAGYARMADGVPAITYAVVARFWQ